MIILFLFLLLPVLLTNFLSTVTQGQACSSCTNTNCCGPACTGNEVCSGTTTYGCDCVTPTSQPVGGAECNNSTECFNNYCYDQNHNPIPNCSSVCINGHCYTTNPNNPSDIPCNTYGSWSQCICNQSAYAGCSQTNYCGQVRFCVDPPNSNQYQINCCTPGGGGGRRCVTRALPMPTIISLMVSWSYSRIVTELRSWPLKLPARQPQIGAASSRPSDHPTIRLSDYPTIRLFDSPLTAGTAT